MTAAKWVTDSTGRDHLVTGDGGRIDEHSAVRIYSALCGVVVGERVSTDVCVDCTREARRRGTQAP